MAEAAHAEALTIVLERGLELLLVSEYGITVWVVEAHLGLLGSKTFLVVNVLLQQAARILRVSETQLLTLESGFPRAAVAV